MSEKYEVLTFLAPGYEEVEMLTVVDMLRRADESIGMVSVADTTDVESSHGVVVRADMLLKDADFGAAKMLVLPGGMPGTLNLKACEELKSQIQSFADDDRLLAAVCAAPTVYGDMGLLKDKRATCYPSFRDSLDCREYLEQPVVRDGNYITSRGMGTCIEFAGEIIAALRSEELANDIKQKIIYI